MNPDSLWSYFLENILYKRNEPAPRTRTVPMQVLAVGLPRSGTESLKSALVTLGYDETFHGWDYVTDIEYLPYWSRLTRQKYYSSSSPWCLFPEARKPALISAAEFDEVIGHCQAITDSGATAFAYDLIRAYPEAKVVLNQRKDWDAWERSVGKAMGALGDNLPLRILRWFNKDLYWLYHLPFEMMYPAIFGYVHTGFLSHVVPGRAQQVALQHVAMVRGLVPKERLLEWTVEDGWEPLCAFLGKEVPKDVPFPTSNSGAEFNNRSDEIVKSRATAAMRNLAICVAVVIAVGAWAYYP